MSHVVGSVCSLFFALVACFTSNLAYILLMAYGGIWEGAYSGKKM